MPVLGSGSKGVVGGIYQATASGAIANGKACIINANGTVSQATSEMGKKILFVVSNAYIYQYKIANDAYDVTEVITKDGETSSTYYYAAQDGVGYGDVYPITVLGKIMASIIALLGIATIAVPTGIITSSFANLTDKEDD